MFIVIVQGSGSQGATVFEYVCRQGPRSCVADSRCCQTLLLQLSIQQWSQGSVNCYISSKQSGMSGMSGMSEFFPLFWEIQGNSHHNIPLTLFFYKAAILMCKSVTNILIHRLGGCVLSSVNHGGVEAKQVKCIHIYACVID